jgi:hypothetical protein
MDIHWLSTPKITVGVLVDGSQIVRTAPVYRKFEGQSITRLVVWLEKQVGGANLKWKHFPAPSVDCFQGEG